MNQSTKNDLSYNHADLDYLELIKTARIAVSYSLEAVSERLRDWRDLKKKPTNLNAEWFLQDATALAISTAMLHYLEEGLIREEVVIVNKPEVKSEG